MKNELDDKIVPTTKRFAKFKKLVATNYPVLILIIKFNI